MRRTTGSQACAQQAARSWEPDEHRPSLAPPSASLLGPPPERVPRVGAREPRPPRSLRPARPAPSAPPAPTRLVAPLSPATRADRSPLVCPERRGDTMLGMIKNSLFGSVETWPWQVLSKGDKVGPQGCRGAEEGPRPPHPDRCWSGSPGAGGAGMCSGLCVPLSAGGMALHFLSLELGRRGDGGGGEF